MSNEKTTIEAESTDAGISAGGLLGVRAVIDYGIDQKVIQELWWLNYFRIGCVFHSMVRGVFAFVESAQSLALPESSLWGMASFCTLIMGVITWSFMISIEVE